METDNSTRAFHLAPDAGRAVWHDDSLMTFKATAQDTGGQLSLWNSLLPAGSSPPLHIHTREDEAFYVIEGELVFQVGDERVHASAGSFVWAPRNVAHSYMVESPTARMITMAVPGGQLENFFLETARPAEALILPPTIQSRPIEEMIAIAERYGCRTVGPPMTTSL